MKRLFYLKIFKNVVENSENNFWSFLKDVLDKIKYTQHLSTAERKRGFKLA
jgi:hypothetical protein